ncbi:MAG: mannose-1-phosphate guanylyltransferase [Candidatus Limimorpha sp.]
MNNNHLIIMAGGVGSRFWPMSIPECPKQFIDVLGIGKTMIQLTVERFKGIVEPEHVWVVTSKKYKDIVMEQLPDVPESHILMEPCMRNTAPCVAYASRKIYARYPDANLVFSPADHLVLDIQHFQEVVNESLQFTQDNNVILTLGMKPSRPETGYGYIKSVTSDNVGNIFKVDTFKEKPDLNTALSYLEQGGYFWNAGIFIWNVKTVVETFGKLVPEISAVFDKVEPHFYQDDEQDIIDTLFPTCPNISIDYAVMEKSDNVFVYPADFGWSDIGTWGSLYTHIPADDNKNALIGENIRMVDSSNCIVRSFGREKVIVQGLDNYIIIDDNNRLLICKMQDEQLIKEWQK